MRYSIPGLGEIELKTIILDLNGTISVGGSVVDGVAERLEVLREKGYRIVLFTGNTRGDAEDIAATLGIEWRQASTALDKRNIALEMQPETCVSIGNGRIDLELMKVVKLGIVTMQSEGVHVATLNACDVVVPTICDALDLIIDEQRLIATLRS